MKKLPERLVDLLKEVKLTEASSTWDCHGTPVILHKALEKIAVYKGITFDDMRVIEGAVKEKYAVISVRGHYKDATEESIGEASPYNNKNSYPYAMAEKRAKDRVILKLLELSGDVYSQEEAEEFKLAQSLKELDPDMRRNIEKWRKGFKYCDSEIALDEAIEQWKRWSDKHVQNSDISQYVEEVYEARKMELNL
tara:strand:- start:2776 stop:3360 length:585 start_codon:yes stop_codon:yes gene_type:complete